MDAQRQARELERSQRQEYLDKAAGGGEGGRRRWAEDRDEEKERLRGEGITLKDKEKEMEAIKVVMKVGTDHKELGMDLICLFYLECIMIILLCMFSVSIFGG